MWRPESIQARLREQPFRPFRIVANANLHFDIHHPDLVLVGERDLTIGLARTADSSIYHRTTRLAIMHLVAIEDLPSPALRTNGESGHA